MRNYAEILKGGSALYLLRRSLDFDGITSKILPALDGVHDEFLNEQALATLDVDPARIKRPSGHLWMMGSSSAWRR